MSQPENFGQESVALGLLASPDRQNRMQTNAQSYLDRLHKSALKSRWVSAFTPSISGGTAITVDHNAAEAWAAGKLYASPHKVKDTTNVVTSANASDLASLQTLLNEIKTDLNAHIASTTYHQAADAVNTITSPNATDLATAIALARELQADYNLHRSESGVHHVADGKNAATSPNPASMSQAEAITLANDLKTQYNAHVNAEIMSDVAFTGGDASGTWYVYIDSSTNALAKSQSLPGNQHVLLCSVSWNGTTLSSLSNLTAAENHMDTLRLATKLLFGVLNGTVGIYFGTGSPEGATTAAIGSLYIRTDGGPGTSVYIKEIGTGNTGWAAGHSGLLAANTSVPAGNTVSNTTVETNFASNFSVPANTLTVGKVLRVTARGVYGTDLTSGATINLRLKLGSTVIGLTGAVTPTINLTNRGWEAQFTITVITTGGSGSVEGQGFTKLATGAAAGQIVDMENTAVVTVDTTAAQTLQISAQWGAGVTANDTITLRQLIVEVLD